MTRYQYAASGGLFQESHSLPAQHMPAAPTPEQEASRARILAPVAVDFETESIERRPQYPPKPVGVAIKYMHEPAQYYAWGHGGGNNCDRDTAAEAIAAAWAHPHGVVMHNAKFDLEVARVHCGIYMPIGGFHDTMILAFLHDPHSKNLSLKGLATSLLGQPPAERDALRAWVKQNVSDEGDWARHIHLAPGDLVGQYAVGDVERTEALYALLSRHIEVNMMGDAYQRELALLPILLDMERHGIRVDLPALKHDVVRYNDNLAKIDEWLRSKLGDGVNLDAPDEVTEAMLSRGFVQADKLARTATGKLSAGKASLAGAGGDAAITGMLAHRANLRACLVHHMQPWLDMAQSTGRIYTDWHQTKHDAGGGARTGRLSSSPNFQNLPNPREVAWGEDGPPITLLPLPSPREYILPDEGHVFIDRDYSQQEPRILAHYCGGALEAAYRENPRIDFHDYARDQLAARGMKYSRKVVKGVNLGLIYGMGIAKLARSVGIDEDDARTLKREILAMYPGIADLYSGMRERAAAKQPIRTWGGRLYHCEPPSTGPDGRVREYNYKLVNVLIQGSAADCTKQALIDYMSRPESERVYPVLLVHDQITVSVPADEVALHMATLRDAMEGVRFDVMMLSDGSWSDKSWADLEPYRESA